MKSGVNIAFLSFTCELTSEALLIYVHHVQCEQLKLERMVTVMERCIQLRSRIHAECTE